MWRYLLLCLSKTPLKIIWLRCSFSAFKFQDNIKSWKIFKNAWLKVGQESSRRLFGGRVKRKAYDILPHSSKNLVPCCQLHRCYFWRKMASFSYVLKTFLFCIGVELIANNVVIVSGEQWRDSAIHIHVSIFLPNPLPSRLPDNMEQSPMYYTVGPCWLSILNIAVSPCPSQTP